HFDTHGSVILPPSYLQGRPSDITMEIREDLVQLKQESPEMFLDEIQEWVAVAHEVAISRPQLHQILEDCAVSYKRLHRAAIERDKALYDQTIYRHYGRSVSEEHATIPANFVRGDRYSLVAALGVEGYAAARVVSGSVDSDEFFDFIVSEVMPTMNPFPGDRSVIIMDNCAIHKLEALHEVVEGMGI
ncbi:hypothetical protein K435DRAFT_576742, partial [Dendrothele bispora CBS 962.96]